MTDRAGDRSQRTDVRGRKDRGQKSEVGGQKVKRQEGGYKVGKRTGCGESLLTSRDRKQGSVFS